MKLDGTMPRCVAILGQDTEGLQDADSARAIVIRTRCRQKREQVIGGVLVRADNGQRLGKVAHFGFKASDDGRLGKRVGEIFKRDVGAKRRVVNDLYLVVNNCFPHWSRLEKLTLAMWSWSHSALSAP
jgi:hypothetical protein